MSGSNVHELDAQRNAILRAQQQAEKSEASPSSSPVDPGGGGPHDPGMEALKARMAAVEGQVTRLEARFDKVEDRLRGVEVKLGEISGKLDLLVARVPSWWQAPVGIVGTVGLLTALAALARALKLLP